MMVPVGIGLRSAVQSIRGGQQPASDLRGEARLH